MRETTPTKFTSTAVSFLVKGHRIELYIDGNSKVTCGEGSFEAPVPNAFSLPHIVTCPDRTPTCEASCYVHGLKKYSPNTYARYAENLRMVQWMLRKDPIGSAQQFAAWIDANRKHFRWHVSGDVFSADYARWIATVAMNSTRTHHWIYTRSHQWAYLLHTPNLTVNLSADKDNIGSARRHNARWGFRICYMTTPGEDLPMLPRGSVIFPDYPDRGRELEHPTDHPWWQALPQRERRMVCPPDFFGQSSALRCGICTKCIRQPAGLAPPARRLPAVQAP